MSDPPVTYFRPHRPVTDDGDSTLRAVRVGRRPPAALWARRSATAALVALVIAGGAGLLGVRSDTRTATVTGGDGTWSLTVTYAATARAGWDVPLSIRVQAPGPLAQRPVTLAIDRAYLDLFETQGWNPDPSSSTGDGDRVELEFDTPADAAVFQADFDAYIQPSAQLGANSRIALLIPVDGQEQEVAAVDITTTLLP
ncbi:hypothetical protein FDO65_16925 [Nakamurella flava]|uniref:Uncharacterized protein n=1 Tax=Nakamurella flava TaxID=2576308 RepID=A0A4U6QD01_9ACTN|nr:hypothetical protein [Nakamurella flava]TKV57816.1 hypothetical protein FDO65_16925 [Nakamurella flava]